MMQGEWRLRLARWLAPIPEELPVDTVLTAAPPDTWVKDAWAQVCEQFALRMLVLAEQLRPALDQLEGDEDDPDRLQWLYHVDHGLSRMRRAARDLRVLAGYDAEEMAGNSSSLLDVIRAAASAIEHYGRVSVGPVVELAVLAYAADDIASLLAVLADNGTRYSPSVVRISAHLLGDGGVMVRVEDSGIGLEPDRLAAVNATLAGPVPEVGAYTGRHTGFPVAHRLARKHDMEVRLACRPAGRAGAGGASGTIAMVTIPASLVCEIPDRMPADPTAPRDGAARDGAPRNGAPRDGAPRDGAPRNGAPRDGAPRDGAHPARGASGRPTEHQPADPPPPAWPVPVAEAVTDGTRPPVAEAVTDRTGPPVTRNGLPRREPGSARNAVLGSRPVPDRGGAPDPASAGQSFAVDVAAFTSSTPDSGGSVQSGAGNERADVAEGRMP
jgi:hypothetical protein